MRRDLFYLILLFNTFTMDAQTAEQNSENYILEVADLSMRIDGQGGARVVSLKKDSIEFLSSKNVHSQFYGSTLWLSPQGKWEHGVLDRSAYKLRKFNGEHLILESSQDSITGFSLVKEFLSNSVDSSFDIKYKIKNISDSTQTVALWEVTRVPTGGLAFLVKKNSNKPSRNETLPILKIKDTLDAIWYPYDSIPGSAEKLFINSGSSWLAYVWEDDIFIKKFPVIQEKFVAPGEKYIELYVNEDKTYLELENQGPYEELLPGSISTYSVKWYVRKLPVNMEASVGNRELISFVEKIIGFAQSSPDEVEVAKAVDLLTEAMLNPEEDLLDSLISPEVSYGHSAGLVEGKDEIIDGLVNGPFRFRNIDVVDQNINVVNNMAIVRQVMELDYEENEVKGSLKFGILLIWYKKDARWRLLARQAVKL